MQDCVLLSYVGKRERMRIIILLMHVMLWYLTLLKILQKCITCFQCQREINFKTQSKEKNFIINLTMIVTSVICINTHLISLDVNQRAYQRGQFLSYFNNH